MASALSFRERQKVVLGKLEFSTTDNIWLWQANPGAEIIFLDAQDERLTAKASEPAINRETPIVTLAHLCFCNAIRSPVSDVERIAHECGALVLLDDYPDFGTRPVDVKVMNLDFDVSGTLKYLLGPPG
jgi:selenocysteine lyase/cysteine desulfurase